MMGTCTWWKRPPRLLPHIILTIKVTSNQSHTVWTVWLQVVDCRCFLIFVSSVFRFLCVAETRHKWLESRPWAEYKPDQYFQLWLLPESHSCNQSSHSRSHRFTLPNTTSQLWPGKWMGRLEWFRWWEVGACSSDIVRTRPSNPKEAWEQDTRWSMRLFLELMK